MGAAPQLSAFDADNTHFFSLPLCFSVAVCDECSGPATAATEAAGARKVCELTGEFALLSCGVASLEINGVAAAAAAIATNFRLVGGAAQNHCAHVGAPTAAAVVFMPDFWAGCAAVAPTHSPRPPHAVTPIYSRQTCVCDAQTQPCSLANLKAPVDFLGDSLRIGLPLGHDR